MSPNVIKYLAVIFTLCIHLVVVCYGRGKCCWAVAMLACVSVTAAPSLLFPK